MAEWDNPCKALYEGDDVTGKVTAAVTGKRFVDISADQDAAIGSAVGATNDVKIAHAAAGAKPFGVSKKDQPTVGGVCGVHCKAKRIVPVTAGATIAAGKDVAVTTNGKAIEWEDVATAASLATGVVGSNNAITWTAKDTGTEGNDLSVTITDPAGNNALLTVDVDQEDIIVSLATDGSSNPTSTATEVMAAVNEHDLASQLVDVASTGASSGAGVVAAVAETALAGGVNTPEKAGKAVTDATSDTDCFVQLY